MKNIEKQLYFYTEGVLHLTKEKIEGASHIEVTIKKGRPSKAQILIPRGKRFYKI